MFATLIVERDLLQWNELAAALVTWTQDAGGVAILAVLAIGVLSLAGVKFTGASQAEGTHLLGRLLAVAVAGLVALYFAAGFFGTRAASSSLRNNLYTAACAIALLLLLAPILRDILFKFRWRRIWALAVLSFKEAKSRGVLWLCVIIPIIYLYADYFIQPKPENQLRNRITVVYFALTLQFFVTAILLGSFSIPNDIKNMTIHTIVTKPVQRYEIVLGRFLGYALLLFVQLAVLSTLSLFYVVRGITPEAAEESYRARVPLYAERLSFIGTTKADRGDSVGREWDYRSYIAGTAIQPKKQIAIWTFPTLPEDLAHREDAVPLEFSFDIFRTTTGEVGKGIFCAFTFAPGGLSAPEVDSRVQKMKAERDNELKKILGRVPGKQMSAELREKVKRIDDQLIEKYGVYVAGATEVKDYHTQSMKVPAVLFTKLVSQQRDPPPVGDVGRPAALQILINVEPTSSTQLLGVARHDMYLLVADRPFWINFFKGAIGIWLGACLVLGIAVMASTYLSGIITFLATLILCGFGLFRDYIEKIAEGTGPEHIGPMEAAHRIVAHKGVMQPLDKNDPGVFVASLFDDGFRFVLRRVFKVFPDVTNFGLERYVAEGFDISWGQVLFLNTLLPLVGYLLCWAVAGYYLIKWREIANPT